MLSARATEVDRILRRNPGGVPIFKGARLLGKDEWEWSAGWTELKENGPDQAMIVDPWYRYKYTMDPDEVRRSLAWDLKYISTRSRRVHDAKVAPLHAAGVGGAVFSFAELGTRRVQEDANLILGML